MSNVGQIERKAQNRVVQMFQDELGYRYLGNRQYRSDNSNIEQEDSTAWLEKQGVSDALITRAMHRLTQAAALGEGRTLYEANREVYGMLRYGVKVKEGAGEQNQTVRLIDWENPETTTSPWPRRSRYSGMLLAVPTWWCTSSALRSGCWN